MPAAKLRAPVRWTLCCFILSGNTQVVYHRRMVGVGFHSVWLRNFLTPQKRLPVKIIGKSAHKSLKMNFNPPLLERECPRLVALACVCVHERARRVVICQWSSPSAMMRSNPSGISHSCTHTLKSTKDERHSCLWGGEDRGLRSVTVILSMFVFMVLYPSWDFKMTANPPVGFLSLWGPKLGFRVRIRVRCMWVHEQGLDFQPWL